MVGSSVEVLGPTDIDIASGNGGRTIEKNSFGGQKWKVRTQNYRTAVKYFSIRRIHQLNIL